jgi:RNA polymerase sigma factor (sigma-70 family)
VALECLTDIFRNSANLKPEQGFVRLVSHMAKLRSVSAARRRKGAQDISLDAALEENDGVSLPLTEDTDDPQELVERHTDAAIVRAEVNKLPEEYRVVIELYFFSECSLSEVGKVLGLPKDRVRYLLEKARKTLHKPLAKQLGFDADTNGGDES